MPTVYIRFPAGPADPSMRAPVLESLLARAGSPASVVDWRAEAFAVIAAPQPAISEPSPRAMARESVPAPAAAALCAAGHSPLGSWVCVATPVHLVAGMTQVTLAGDGLLRLDATGASHLAASFNELFQGGGMRLVVGRDAVLLCVFDRMLDVRTHDPDDVVGRDVFGHQPSGPDSTRLRGLMSEIEMWLFEHVVNRSRTAAGLPVISGLWLWGGGPVLDALPLVSGWTAGLDPLFGAFGNAPAFPGLGAALRAGVVVCAESPGSAGWGAFETRWLGPAAAGLQAGRVGRLELSAGARRFSVSGRWPWRFWRRPRPWWQMFEIEGSE